MFELKQDDLLPILTGRALRVADGAPIDGASAPFPRFLMRPSGAASPVINATAGATWMNASQGELAFIWPASSTATAGYFQGEFELTFPQSKKQTVPGRGFIPIVISEDVG